MLLYFHTMFFKIDQLQMEKSIHLKKNWTYLGNTMVKIAAF